MWWPIFGPVKTVELSRAKIIYAIGFRGKVVVFYQQQMKVVGEAGFFVVSALSETFGNNKNLETGFEFRHY